MSKRVYTKQADFSSIVKDNYMQVHAILMIINLRIQTL